MPKKLDNLVGQKFGRLIVIKYGGLVKSGKQKTSTWICVCNCGKEVIVLNNNLKRNSTRSCGCLQLEIVKQIKSDLIHKKFGLLTVLKYLQTINGNSVWLCKCECGRTCEATTGNLQTGKMKSCGCKQGWWRSNRPGLWKNSAAYVKWRREDPIRKLRHGVSSSIRKMLRHRATYKRKKSIRNFLPYSIEELKLHLESQWESWMNWSNYGGRYNDEKRTWQIDHIKPHSSFNYTSMNDPLFKKCWSLGNLRPLEKKENMRKGAKV